MNRHSMALGFLILPVSILAAQPRDDDDANPVTDPATFPWPESLAAGHFGRVEAAQLTEDMVADMVIARGPQGEPGVGDDVIAVAYGPSIHRAVIAIPGLGSDFTVLRGAGPHGRDAIAISHADGLRFVTIEDGASEFSIVSWNRLAFAHARRLRATDIDGDGDQDVIALHHDGKSVHVALQSEPGEFVVGPAFFASTPAKYRDIVCLRSLDDAPPHFALLDADGLHFGRASTSDSVLKIDMSYLSFAAEDSIAALEGRSDIGADVAWITRDPSLRDPWLAVADETMIDPDPVRLEGQGARKIVCEDFDGDGDRDAFISREAWTGALLVYNESSSGTFPFQDSFSLQWSLTPDNVTPSPEPIQHAWPAVVDLDGNGWLDAFFACEAARRLGWTTIPPPGTDSGSGPEPWRSAPTIVSASYQNEPLGVMSPTSNGKLRLRVKVATDFGPDVRLHYASWRQPSFGAVTESTATSAAALSIPPSGGGGTIHLPFDIDIAETGPYPFSAIYWIAVRLVHVNPVTQRIDDAGQATLVAFAASHEGTNFGPSLDPLHAEPVTGPTIEVGFEAGGFFSSAVQCGGVVPKAAIPFFPPNTIPIPNPQSSSG